MGPKSRSVVFGGLLLLGACSSMPQLSAEQARVPRAVRTGVAEMALERVEPDVSRAEVAEAVSTVLAGARICLAWPGLWLQGDDRRTLFVVRFDMMARDWGPEIAAESERRMRDFVSLGFLTVRDRPDLGAGALEFALTPAGDAALQGSPYGGARPSFCGPLPRRLVEIQSLEFGQFECGSLRVGFTHIGDDWPAWATTAEARERIAAAVGTNGQAAHGTVTLSRQWFRPGESMPDGRPNGALRSACYDTARARVTGNDLVLRTDPQ